MCNSDDSGRMSENLRVICQNEGHNMVAAVSYASEQGENCESINGDNNRVWSQAEHQNVLERFKKTLEKIIRMFIYGLGASNEQVESSGLEELPFDSVLSTLAELVQTCFNLVEVSLFVVFTDNLRNN